MLTGRMLCFTAMVALVGCARDVAGPPGARVLEVRRVSIRYQYAGWGSFQESFDLVRRPNADGFDLVGRYLDEDNQQRRVRMFVGAADVRAFADAISAPPLGKSAGLGELAGALQRPKPDFSSQDGFSKQRCNARELRRLARQHLVRVGVMGLLDDVYASETRWTDDYPFVLVELVREDGSRAWVYSKAQQALMLPWRMGTPPQSRPEPPQNWSPAISQALRGLLPSSSRLADRLRWSRVEDVQQDMEGLVEYAANTQCNKIRAR